MTIIVGITGGIGSGKSTLSKEIRKKNFKLLDSDEIVANIYNKPTKSFIKYLKKIELGNSIKGKKINKKQISNVIFSNNNIKSKLEDYIFKIVRKKREIFIKNEKKRKTNIIFLDIPLLFENNLNRSFNIIISVISSKKERYKRLKISKNMSKEMFNKIIKSQTSDIVRKRKSDIIIINNSTMEFYIKKINNMLEKIVPWEK